MPESTSVDHSTFNQASGTHIGRKSMKSDGGARRISHSPIDSRQLGALVDASPSNADAAIDNSTRSSEKGCRCSMRASLKSPPSYPRRNLSGAGFRFHPVLCLSASVTAQEGIRGNRGGRSTQRGAHRGMDATLEFGPDALS